MTHKEGRTGAAQLHGRPAFMRRSPALIRRRIAGFGLSSNRAPSGYLTRAIPTARPRRRG